MTNPVLEKERTRIFASEDRDLYLHVGYFFAWYNQVEWKITVIMAIVMNERDLPAFDQLVRGMDAKTKVRRLRNICKLKKRQIGDALSKRLDHFEDKLCIFRDRLAHRALVRDEKIDRFHFATIERMPWKVLGVASAKKEPPPDHVDALKLFEYGYWMNHFGDDLNEVIDRAIEGRSLDIANPRSPLPQAPHANSPPPTASPTPDTPPQTTPETRE
jgi:hypothetical protein